MSPPLTATRSAHFTVEGHSIPARGEGPGLYLVATPIGHLKDVTLRALNILACADVIACEDTRVTRGLLKHYGIQTPLISYHEHNAERAGPELIQRLQNGESVALVSDAGTPLVSDPGYRLVQMALDVDRAVVALPGASAVLAALCVSGLPNDRFVFCGFLPNKDKARRDALTQLKAETATQVHYESPRRILNTLTAIIEVMGPERSVVVARELTKSHETVHRGAAQEVLAACEADTLKGEIVLLIGPPDNSETEDIPQEALDAMLLEAAQSMSASKAAGSVAKETGLRKQVLYDRLQDIKDRPA